MKPDTREAILLAAADVILPVGFDGARLPARLRASIAITDPAKIRDLELGLTLLDSRLTSLMCGCGFRRFSRHTPANRARLLERFHRSRFITFRTIYLALHRLVASSYYSDPVVQRTLGYAGPRSAA